MILAVFFKIWQISTHCMYWQFVFSYSDSKKAKSAMGSPAINPAFKTSSIINN